MRSSLTTIERKEIFDEVRRLSQSNVNFDVSTLRVALSARFPLLPSRETLKRWLAGETSPTTSMNDFDGKPSEQLSFFLGGWLGDGWADDSDGGKRLLLKVRSYDFAKEFARSAGTILQKTEPYWVRRISDERGLWYLVKVTSLMLYEFVNQPIERLCAVIDSFPKDFLRGFFTAEGNPSVSINTRRRYLDVGLCVSNTDHQLLEFSRGLLISMGFRPARIKLDRGRGERTNLAIVKNPLWQYNLSRLADVVRFSRQVGFADTVKQRKLNDAIFNIRRYGRIMGASEWMRQYEKSRGEWVRKQKVATTIAA